MGLYMENHREIISGKLEDIVSGDGKYLDNVRIFSKFPDKRAEVAHIFDAVAKQVEKLMNDSYRRFRQTPAYHRLLKKLVKDQRKNKNKETFLSKTSAQLSVLKEKLSTKNN